MNNTKSKSKKTKKAISAPKKSKLPISEVVLVDMNKACIILRKPAYAVYKLINKDPAKNTIRHFRVAGKILFSREDLQAYISGKKYTEPPFSIFADGGVVEFDIPAAATFLNLSVSKLYKMTSKGPENSLIPHTRNGGLIVLKKNDLIQWVNNCSIGVNN